MHLDMLLSAANTSSLLASAAAAAPFVPGMGSTSNSARPASMSSAAAPFVPKASAGDNAQHVQLLEHISGDAATQTQLIVFCISVTLLRAYA